MVYCNFAPSRLPYRARAEFISVSYYFDLMVNLKDTETSSVQVRKVRTP